MNTFHGKLEVMGSEATISTLLEQVTTLGGEENYLILFSRDPSNEGYVQFIARCGDPEVLCEAAGNAFIAGILGPEGEARLVELGWQPSEDGNPFQERSCRTPEDRRAVAALALQTLREVYGSSTGGLSVELNLG